MKLALAAVLLVLGMSVAREDVGSGRDASRERHERAVASSSAFASRPDSPSSGRADGNEREADSRLGGPAGRSSSGQVKAGRALPSELGPKGSLGSLVSPVEGDVPQGQEAELRVADRVTWRGTSDSAKVAVASARSRPLHSKAYYRMAFRGQLAARRERERTIRRLRRELKSARAATRERKVPARSFSWTPAFVTSYADFEPGVSGGTACPSPWGTLDTYGYTVAVTYGIGLDGSGGLPACGTKIILSDGRVEHEATVNDRTLSSYDLELSPALSWKFGAPRQLSGTLTWSGHLRWRLA